MLSDAEIASENDQKAEGAQSESTTKRRTKTGCLTCRKRRIKCGEERPICKNCIKSRRECAGYNSPLFYDGLNGQPNSEPNSDLLTGAEFQWMRDFPSSIGVPLNYNTTAQPVPQPLSTNLQAHVPSDLFVPSPSLNLKVDPRSTTWPMRRPSDEACTNPYDMSQNTIGAPKLASREEAGSFRTPSAVYDAFEVPSTIETQLLSSNLQVQARDVSVTREVEFGSHNDLDTGQRFSVGIKQQRDIMLPFGEQITDSLEYQDDGLDNSWTINANQAEHLHHHQKHARRREPCHVHSHTMVSGLRSSKSNALVPERYSSTRSPFFSETSQRILKHFMSITGPCIGMFDRYGNPISTDSKLKKIWTHDLPAMAFQCPALAHAILAVSAMHMFKLNLGSESIATKHFTQALKRVGPSLGNQAQRHEISTLGTILLLGYYEVMTGDHSRWNLHLSGAGKLVMEHDYASYVRTVNRMRARLMSNIAEPYSHSDSVLGEQNQSHMDTPSMLLSTNEWRVDQKLISRLMGYDINYDVQAQPNFRNTSPIPDFDQKSLDNWRVLNELYWFYCKQDIYMSMLSGDPLLLPYSQWKYCPPRGPLNNPDHPHTTLDHLWLILARLANFGGKDRKRKQRVVNAQGGQWIPASGSFGSTSPSPNLPNQTLAPNDCGRSAPPSANEGRARTTKPGTGRVPRQPPFPGMMPPVNSEIYMPLSFKLMDAELRSGLPSYPHDADSPQGSDLLIQTQCALEEHASITEAFDLFESCLGPEYQPLQPGDIQISTPFGTALQYKSPTIATIWAFFFVGRILLRRLHPHSPPAAMVSAAINASTTQHLAQKIGRVCGGLFAQHSYLLQAGHVDTSLSAAVMEATFPLMFAAVQFKDQTQRGWTISKLSEIARVAGWQTSLAVGGACERMWEKEGEAGIGPPYRRTMDRSNEDVRVNGQHSYGQTHPLSTTVLSPAEEHESRFVRHDRNLINKHASTRAHWALGLLSAEEDLQRITINDSG